MVARIRGGERRLASGRVARVIRVDVDGFAVVPLFRRRSSEAEATIARVLGEARTSGRLASAPPADDRLAEAVDVDLGDAGPTRLVGERAAVTVAGASLAPLHLLRLAASGLSEGELLVNGNYFLFLTGELTSPFDAYGDPVGLTLAGGVVETPPQLPRGCLMLGDGGAALTRLGFADCSLRLDDETPVAAHPFGPPALLPGPIAFSLFHGSERGRTPLAADVWEAAYVGRFPVAIHQGGGLPIPRAGCVVRLAPGQDRGLLARPVSYRMPTPLREAVQAGPMIVEDGRSLAADQDVFRREFMMPHAGLPDDWPVSPYAWKADWDKTVAARLAAGIDGEGRLFFCAVEGSSAFAGGQSEPQGASLADLAVLMVEEGADRALNLDGGASVQMFGAGGGALVAGRDIHHGMPDSPAQIDRPLPLALRLY